jgi:predicted nucleic acid-binding protein
MASVLLDTNVLLRLIDRNDARHVACSHSIETLLGQGEDVFLAPQVLIEFWVVSTRPTDATPPGFGWKPQTASQHLAGVRKTFRMLDDAPGVFERWLYLVETCSIHGKRAHDARLVAFMQQHGIEQILTLNPKDFAGLGVKIVQPQEVGVAP